MLVHEIWGALKAKIAVQVLYLHARLQKKFKIYYKLLTEPQ